MNRAFVISPEAATVDSREREWLRNRLEIGDLLGGSSIDWRAFYHSLPSREKQLWLELLAHAPHIWTRSISEIESFDDAGFLADVSANGVETVVGLGQDEIDRFRATTDDRFPIHRPPCEFLPVAELRTSELCRKADRRFPAGSERDRVWKELFGPIFLTSSSLVIVDKFIFDRLIPGRSRSPNGSGDGIAWLLGMFESKRRRGRLKITIVTSFDDETCTREEALEIGRRARSDYPGIELNLHVARRRSFRNVIHERYLRMVVNGEPRRLVMVEPGFDGLDTTSSGRLRRKLIAFDMRPSPGEDFRSHISEFLDDEKAVASLAAQSGVMLDR